MSAKKQSDRLEAVRDAATGYAAVVLGIVCFLLALVIVMAGVRIVVGASGTGTTGTTVTATRITSSSAGEAS